MMIKARVQDRARIEARLGTPSMVKIMPDGVEIRMYYGRRPGTIGTIAEPILDTPTPLQADVDASASALALAAAYNIDLSGVEGSGKGGRILKSDVEALGTRVHP